MKFVSFAFRHILYEEGGGKASMKVAFLDRDGTIIEDYSDEVWTSVTAPVFIPEAINVLHTLTLKGYDIIIVTNQYLIEEAYITQAQYEQITEKMLQKLEEKGICVLDIFYCPHRRDAGCSCLKPRKGLIMQAVDKYPQINLNTSVMIGDSDADMLLAQSLNMKGFGIGIGKEYKEGDITQVSSIKEVMMFIP
jgi:D-glycero-D-manno-heptose 1,7-bisphosphate phosphatase